MFFEDYINLQREWSERTFGDGRRTVGLCRHIEKELNEIKRSPDDLFEWIDVVILAIDGAWRAGYSPEQIIEALLEKQQVNFERRWPAPQAQYEPTEHIGHNEHEKETKNRQVDEIDIE